MNKEVTRASLRLFNAIAVDDGCMKKGEAPDEKLMARTVKHGYILPSGLTLPKNILSAVEDVVGISGEKANSAFHKSWAVVRDSSDEDLIIQQIIHYMTTYGFEALGIYDKSTVYVPDEHLDVPVGNMPLTVIKAFNYTDMNDAVVKLGASGIALHEDTLTDIMTLVEFFDFAPTITYDMKNRELKARMMDYYGLVPNEPVEFLRHVISKLTDESLIIKNPYMVAKIKEASGKHLDDLMKDAPADLASIFLRYKPLFLAMRSISRHKHVFNRLRKQAITMHKPLPVDYLNDVTSQIKNDTINKKTLKKKLEDAPLFRKIRLAYALQYRLVAGDSIVYQVRSGRGWATPFSWDTSLNEKTEKVLKTVLKSIARNIKAAVAGKKILLPDNIKYALPATEKQFVGGIPAGSYVSVDADMIVGVYWKNVKSNRIDLDFSTTSIAGKIGWNAAYRTDRRNVMFSGDVTDPPPKGATELFYFSGDDPYPPAMFSLNYYNYCESLPVPMKLFIASERIKDMHKNYMIDQNNIITSVNMKITEKQTDIGMYIHTGDEARFFFQGVSIGNSISSRVDENTTRTRKFLEAKLMNPILLNTLLELADVEIITEPPKPLESGEVEEYVDLSPEALTKSTIIDLLQGV